MDEQLGSKRRNSPLLEIVTLLAMSCVYVHTITSARILCTSASVCDIALLSDEQLPQEELFGTSYQS